MVDFIIRYRWIIICSAILLGAGAALLIPFIKSDPEIRNYIPLTMNSRIETDKIENEFGIQDIVVILFTDSCILTQNNLTRIRKIDEGISRISGIERRISPFTIRSIRNEDGTMIASRLIKNIPSGTNEINALAGEIRTNHLAKNVVISDDMTSACITATIGGGTKETVTLGKIDSVLALYPGSAEVAKGGLPYIRKHILIDVKRDGLRLVPVALIIMLMVLKLMLGDWKSVLIPFTVVLISTAASIGLIVFLGWKMSIMTLLVPVLLVAVANNYGIYLVARYQELSSINSNASDRTLINELLHSLNMPVLFSGLTTIAGILGLLTHSVIPARQVGVLAASGVTLALLLSLFLIPALIFVITPLKAVKNRRKVNSRLTGGLLLKLSGLIIRRHDRILILSAIATIGIFAGILQIKVDTNQENYFPRNNPVRKASDLINERFGGSQTISVMISGDIKDPVVLSGIDKLTTSLEAEYGVGKVFSISQVVREMSKAIYSIDEHEYNNIPAAREAIAQMFELYYMSGDQGDFDQLMNPDNSMAHILIRLNKPENGVIKNIKKLVSSSMAAIPAETITGGYAVIMADFAMSVINGQVISLIFALFTVWILLSVIFKSFSGGLTGSIPLAGSIMVLFGFMGLSGIAIDAATALLSSIMIGVGVDFTIQYLWCFNSFVKEGFSYEGATEKALTTIGRSIIINALSVMAGFSALMLSGFTSIRFFGYLVLISIGCCLFGAIVVIPSFMIKFRPRFIEKDLINGKVLK